jgi:hypothetical protein
MADTPAHLVVQDVNRAAAEANRFTFEATTIKPLADLIADALTNQLAADFDSRLVVRFEDFITVDKTFELEKSRALLASKVVTINEIRLREGLSPATWGELLRRPLAGRRGRRETSRAALIQRADRRARSAPESDGTRSLHGEVPESSSGTGESSFSRTRHSA